MKKEQRVLVASANVFLFYVYRKEKNEGRRVVSRRERRKNKDLSLTKVKTTLFMIILKNEKKNKKAQNNAILRFIFNQKSTGEGIWINNNLFRLLIISIKMWVPNLTNLLLYSSKNSKCQFTIKRDKS